MFLLKIFLIVNAILFVTCQENTLDETLNEEYDKWINAFKKDPTVSVRRRRIWEENFKQIEKHNEEAKKGLQTYTQGLNEYSDLSFNEFARQYLGLKVPRGGLQSVSNYRMSGKQNPPQVDWRTQGLVTPVRNQQSCGSCWAFTAAHAVEAYYTLATNRSRVFSPQQMVDCDRASNQGCQGGWMTDAFAYLRVNGLQEESTYTYANTQNSCKYDRSKAVANITGHVVVTQGQANEAALTDALANVGPIAIAVYVSSGFQNYKSGVYFDSSYTNQFVNHAVLAVGYGTRNGQDFYTIKNTWGSSWGENGYIHLARNRNNHLGVSSYCSYPLVAGDFNSMPTPSPSSSSTQVTSSTSTRRSSSSITTTRTTPLPPPTTTRSSNVLTSTILNQNELNLLISLGRFRASSQLNGVRLALLYRASRDGYTPADFHRTCDNQTNTLVLVRTSTGSNNVFGGFTTQAWSSEFTYKQDQQAFLFTLRRSGRTQAQRLNIRDARYAIGCSSEFGPIFGGGFDLMIQNRVGSAGGLGFTYELPLGLTYMSQQAQTFLAGAANFQINELEVFQVLP